ncbi:MAG TPA: class I lanthipeptide [Thermoanaerobaculia bacterium]|nr:class I lanthipeptide [Thermoanaerobaculia bacterium]
MRRRLKKKLSLSRETLGNLQAEQLGKVAGGTGCTLEDLTTCVCTDACNSDTGGTGGTGTGSGPQCPTLTVQDWTCCGNC